MSERDEAKFALWLATPVGKMGPSYPLGISRVGPASIINPLLTKREVKMAVTWPHFLFFFLAFFIDRVEYPAI